MDMYVFLVGVKGPEGSTIGYWLKYGRIQLISFLEPVLPEDVSIAPGEKYTFKISKTDAKSWEVLKAKEGRAEPKSLKLLIQRINFGDGTGFRTTSGKPVNIHQKVGRGGPSRAEGSLDSPETSNCYLPAILPVKFFKEDRVRLFPALLSVFQGSCGSGCEVTRESFYTCSRTCDPQSDRPTKDSFGCINPTNPDCACQRPVDQPNICFDPGSGLPLTCHDVILYDCFTGSGPEDGGATCFDGIDNDADGFTDCQEPACMSEFNFEGPYYPAGGGLDCYLCSDGLDNDCDLTEDSNDNDCALCYSSPILIDATGNGFNLTDAANGTLFDLDANGTAERVGWTAVGSDDVWLALDRNSNGSIENGQELFGNFTPQPLPPSGEQRNGFLALAEYDKPQSGGNGDGKINPNDAIFSSLRLWKDTNHNGFSEPSELLSLPQLALTTIELNYKESRRTDQYGNLFRYRAKVNDRKGLQLGRWAWDVILVRGQQYSSQPSMTTN
jgi:hypothetical protein